MKLLIADDNLQIQNILASYAKKEGYEVLLAQDGYEALKLAEQADVILLDVMMPKLDGFSVCKELRKHSNIPILMVTARGEDYEKIMGLDIGADDYIVKPFSPAEVMARVKAILRRLEPKGVSKELRIDHLFVSLETFQVSIDQHVILLTKKEIELLFTLASHPERAYSREQLLDSVWGYDYYGDARTVDSHITRLRSKLDVVKHPNWNIKTVWGIGYKFEHLGES
jgi:DNA-binding response OmpR family regulator